MGDQLPELCLRIARVLDIDPSAPALRVRAALVPGGGDLGATADAFPTGVRASDNPTACGVQLHEPSPEQRRCPPQG